MDAGDGFFPADVLFEPDRPAALAKAQVAARAMARMAYDVVCPGEIDFAGGLDFYKDLIKVAGVSAVCANLTLDGKPLFPPYVVREIAGIRFGILGLLWPDMPLRVETTGALKLTSPIDAARACVAQLEGKVDVIVALTHEGLQADRNLAEQVQPIHLILGGHSRDWQGRASIVKGSWIYQDGSQCQNIGRLSLQFRPGGDRRKPVEITRVFEDLVILTEKFPLDGAVKKLVDDYKAQAAKQASLSGGAGPAPGPSEPGEVYWGQELCVSCHAKQGEFWAHTKHAHAYQTLVSAHRQSEVECLSCHVTGFKTLQVSNAREGFPASDVAEFENVQCEACHGPGSSHSRREIRTHAHAAATCMACHTKERSPRFDFASFLPRVQCPKGP